jgi:hypothetical protein
LRLPGSGTFSQLDTVMGSAQDPLSLNRFLYAHANPATLIDPTGHMICEGDCGGNPTAAEVKATREAKVKTVKQQQQHKHQQKQKQNQQTRSSASNAPSHGPLLAVPSSPLTLGVLQAALQAIAIAQLRDWCRANDSVAECLAKTSPDQLCELLDPPGGSPTGGCRTEVVYNASEVYATSVQVGPLTGPAPAGPSTCPGVAGPGGLGTISGCGFNPGGVAVVDIAARAGSPPRGRRGGTTAPTAGVDLHNLASRIGLDDRLIREARRAGKSEQIGIDALTRQLAEGNRNPGIASRALRGLPGILEARARGGARVYYRVNSNGIEILAKSTKSNQAPVIDLLNELYGS